MRRFHRSSTPICNLLIFLKILGKTDRIDNRSLNTNIKMATSVRYNTQLDSFPTQRISCLHRITVTNISNQYNENDPDIVNKKIIKNHSSVPIDLYKFHYK